MRRPLIITIGIVIILLVLGMWAYLLVFGTPKQPREVFANLGFLSTHRQEAATSSPITTAATSTADANGMALQQVSTRAVAGYAFLDDHTVRYVERGTGYVYQVDLNSKTETELSHTTIQQTSEAIFSASADTVIITSYDGYQKKSVVANLTGQTDQELTLKTLPTGADDLAFKDQNTIYFAISTDKTTSGYSYDLRTLAQKKLFAVNAGDLRAEWGNGLKSMYLVSKPAVGYPGYAYTVSEEGIVTPISSEKDGLTAFMNNSYVVTTFASSSEYISEALQNFHVFPQAEAMIPQKCAFADMTGPIIWCGGQKSQLNRNFLEDWYKGTVISHDDLWRIDLTSGKAVRLMDLSAGAGRVIDVSGLTAGLQEKALIFENKVDGTLWVYHLPQ